MKKTLPESLVKFTLMILIILVAMIAPTMAGTEGAELSPAYEKFSGIFGGAGGRIIALFFFFLGTISCALKFNSAAILSFFGVAIGVGSVSFIVDSTVTCLLCF